MTKPAYPSQTLDKFIIRFPEGMRDRIAQHAEAAGRTMTAEIVKRLEQSFSERASPDEIVLRVEGDGVMPLQKLIDLVHELEEKAGHKFEKISIVYGQGRGVPASPEVAKKSRTRSK